MIVNLLLEIAPYVIGGIALAAAVLGIRIEAKKSGRDQERAAQTKRTVEHANARRKVDDVADAAGGDANRQWLRDRNRGRK
jgi:hypothetical protein